MAECMVVSFERKTIQISFEVYKTLFDNSSVYHSAPYQHSLESKRLPFATLIDLSRKANIPYSLFFAPQALVDQNIKRNNEILLQGVGKNTFSINSRGNVELRDIELILKDLIRKQTLLKKYSSFPDNVVLGKLKKPGLTITEQASLLRELLGIDLELIQKLNKQKTFEYLVSCLEAKNVFVSQSSRTFMPQTIHNSVSFSGICVRDKKVPFIFINSRDEDQSFEPAGRRILTLILLCVCLSKLRFKPVSYTEQSKDLINDKDFEIAEEILLPRESIEPISINTISDLNEQAAKFSVTPSALLMRLRRLRRVGEDEANGYIDILRQEFQNNREKIKPRPPADVNGFKKYNGLALSKAVIGFVDHGHITNADVRKILFFNKVDKKFLSDYRRVL